MRILSVDSSSVSASVSITEDNETVKESFVNNGLTHSETLVPMIEEVSGGDLSNIDLIAVTAGPGSFTGVRIGISAVKGVADALGIKCFPLSTLEAIAEPLKDKDLVACAVMDARCSQVYTASFYMGSRITEDRAILIDELKKDLIKEKRDIMLIGDGAVMCYNLLKDDLPNLLLADEDIRLIHGSSLGRLAYIKIKLGETPIDSGKLLPVYLRVPQAERELKKKNGGEKK
ncbi:MAG: tRNA (adenosine(37)-N6)-threonylcarbamoyltransferase complex dimerization subunit type 1 TsaB [Clostridiales bacterium]|nr:tRNA (adenosine(37)-N6)-threonylcarbamoyltransferase complex dimerization subunit type 1 TsaB [Clostridiales bacterium]